MSPARSALGFRAGRGGSVVVGVAVDSGRPRLLLSAFLATAAEGDRLAFEPYHVAFEMAAGAKGEVPQGAVAAVAEGRRRQEAMAVRGLDELVARLSDKSDRPVLGALLINRAGWMTDLLQYSLFDPSHPPVAEGLAVRDALRFAARHSQLELVEMDEKSLTEAASIKLGLSSGEIEGRLKALGDGTKPWRKEEKAACLAAWLAAAAV